jgi:hypothetical protein
VTVPGSRADQRRKRQLSRISQMDKATGTI